MTTGDIVKKLRLEKGLSQEELGKMIGVQRAAINKYETGVVVNLKRSTVAKLATALGVSPAVLMGWEDAPPASNLEPMPQVKKVPIVGEIACGAPILAEQNITDYADMPNNITADFALICKGDSMVGAGIKDGDIVYIRKQNTAENGQIVAVITNDNYEATLKRFYRDGNKVTLTPENPSYPPMVYVNEEINALRIIGKAVAYLHKF